MSSDLQTRLKAELDDAPLATVVDVSLSTFGSELRIACSLGAEDMILVHEVARASKALGLEPRVFLLDTGRLHQETHDLADRVRERYGLAIESYSPDASLIEDLVRRSGPNGFYHSIDERRACCDVRKVKPLKRALAGARAWMTGMRREQSPTRGELEIVETDGELLKLNPLARWTEEEVWRYVADNKVPTHALQERGYRSIGCAPCTRAVAPGESVRSGRWWWEAPEHKECGLHPRRTS